jgi:hypothetical protein
MFGMTVAVCMLATGAGTMDLDFPGGTVAEWKAAIYVASPDANIVIDDGVRDVLVSAMKFDVIGDAVLRASLGQQALRLRD